MGGGEDTDTVKNVLCGSQDLSNSLSQQMRQPGHRTPFSHSHPTWRPISLSPKHLPPSSLLPLESGPIRLFTKKITARNLPSKSRPVATDRNQPRHCSGVPPHVTSGASQPLFVRGSLGIQQGQTKRKRSRRRVAETYSPSSPTTICERLGKVISQFLTSAPSDGDIGTCVDHRTDVSMNYAKTYWENVCLSTGAHPIVQLR